MAAKNANSVTYTERMGTIKCPSCGSKAEIVATTKDGRQTIICGNCDLDKTSDYSSSKA